MCSVQYRLVFLSYFKKGLLILVKILSDIRTEQTVAMLNFGMLYDLVFFLSIPTHFPLLKPPTLTLGLSIFERYANMHFA